MIILQGRTFRSQIENNLSKSEYFLHSLLPEYETGPGKALYDKNLTLCESKFPGYVAEIQGMANGSGVPFHKVAIFFDFAMVSYLRSCLFCPAIPPKSGSVHNLADGSLRQKG